MSAFDLISTMQYGDATSLRSFFNSHNIQHQLYAAKIITASVTVPSFDVSDQGALDSWVDLMEAVQEKRGDAKQSETINNWLNMHMELHRGEMSALGLGDPLDIAVVDFGVPDQFYDWMLTHQQMHAAEDAALGI